jgi:hypothetical protein
MPNLSVPDDDPQRPLPRRQPSYIHFTPRRAMQSFDNLVALANHAERLKDARRIVWRDRGEPVVELRDLQGCLLHAGKGAVRAWSIGAVLSGRPKTDRLICFRRGQPCVRHSRRCEPLSASIQAQAHAPVCIRVLVLAVFYLQHPTDTSASPSFGMLSLDPTPGVSQQCLVCGLANL